jgi:transcriptional regulator with XRE-family HTH domain
MEVRKKLQLGRPKGSKTFEPTHALAFGEVIREQRLLVKMSQEELSHLAGVERSHMGKIERGEHVPNLVLIFRLASALSVKPGLLVDQAYLKVVDLTLQSQT